MEVCSQSPGAVPRIRQSETLTREEMSVLVLRRQVRDRLRGCHPTPDANVAPAPAGTFGPAASQSLQASFVIGSDGSLSQVAAKGSGGNEALTACVVHELNGVQTAAVEGGSVVVRRFPIVFCADGTVRFPDYP